MSIAALDNLVKIRQLSVEPRNENEIRRLLRMAQTHLVDAQQSSVSVEGRYLSRMQRGIPLGLQCCATTDTAAKIATLCFSRLRTHLSGPQSAGACSTQPTAPEIWRSTKGLWRLSFRR